MCLGSNRNKTTMVLKHTWYVFLLICALLGFLWYIMISYSKSEALIFILLMTTWFSTEMVKAYLPGQSLTIDSNGITCIDRSWRGTKITHFSWTNINKIKYNGHGNFTLFFRINCREVVNVNFCNYYLVILWINDKICFSLTTKLAFQTLKIICKENHINFIEQH